MTPEQMHEMTAAINGLREDFAAHAELDLEAHRHAAEDRDKVLASVQGLVDAWNASQGFLKVIRLIGKITAWFGGIALALGAIWAFVKLIWMGKP